jgi:hypothetical protein
MTTSITQRIWLVGRLVGRFSRRGIAAQQAMCGSVYYRNAETLSPLT